jgi:hypothetical protein
MQDRPSKKADLYETDFFAWSQQQAKLLRARRWEELDLDNLAEEVMSVGRSEQREIRNRLVVLMAHLLKWKYQPGLRGPSWVRTLMEQRLQLQELVKDSPSLRRYPAKAFPKQYLAAQLEASMETGIAVELFPEACPFTIEEILDVDFLPEEPGRPGR